MDFDAVIFDLDGTIADTIPLTVYSLKEAVIELTGKVYSDEALKKEFGPIDTEIIKKLVDDRSSEASPEIYIKHFNNNFERFVKPIEGINQLLSYIKSKKIKLGLFTGRSLRVTDIVLEKLGIRDMFDAVIAGDFTANPKPDPEGILKALEALNARSLHSIYVGDFDVDIAASKAAGTKAALALWSSTGDKKLIKLMPDIYFESPLEFINWLDKMANS